MKFVIDRDSLHNALMRSIKGMDMNSTLPILSGVLIHARDGLLTLETSNMEVSIKQDVLARIEEEGTVVVPCKLLSEIVSHLPDVAITCEVKGALFNLTCGGSFYTMNTMAAQDFPQFPTYELDSVVEIPTESLNTMISSVAVAASTDKSRSVLNGVLVNISSNFVRFVATDSMRLAVAETQLAAQGADLEVIAPTKTLRNVLGLAAEEKSIRIGLNQTQIVFMFGSVIYITRRIEGAYPRYQRYLPSTYVTSVKIKISDLCDAMQRIKSMTVSNSEIRFDINAEDGLLIITSNLVHQGSAYEELAAEVVGENQVIAFNSRLIYDCVQRLESEDDYVTFQMEASIKPGIFKTFGKINYLHLVMPVKITQ